MKIRYVGLADLAPREGIRMVEIVETETNELEQIVFSVAVKVTKDTEDGEVTVTLPPELRPTERLASYLQTILKARELTIKHWAFDVDAQRDESSLRAELENLSNVMVEEQTKERD